jgi:hypothetical protein
MDNLEKFILENRAAFDTAAPNLKVWAEIDRRMEHGPLVRRITWIKKLRVAAAAVVLLTAGGMIGYRLSSSATEVKSLADVSPEHAEMERYFASQVDEKLTQLAAYRQDGYVRADLQQLDTMYEELKLELQQAPPGADEKVIQAMIENYQTKIDILEQVLEKVQTTNPTNLKTEENEVSL